MNQKSALLMLFLLLASILTACGSPAPVVAPVNPTKTSIEPTQPTSTFPTGRFIKSGTTDSGLVFNDGTFSVFQGGNTIVTASYKVEGNVFTETSNNAGCKTNVSFNYTFDGMNLTFKYVDKPEDDLACNGRHADFNNVTYILTPLSLPFPTGKFVRADRVDPVGFIFSETETWQAWDKYMNIAAKGTYGVDGETYTELSNDMGCSVPISFKYTYDGKTLTFNYIDDPAKDKCDARRAALDNVSYTLAGE